MCQDRIQAIRDWIAPTGLRQLREFLGFTNVPLTALLKKNVPWRWTDIEQSAFDGLKSAFDTTVVETDASDFAISGVLSQLLDGRLRPVAFFSRKLRDAELNYDVHDKELLINVTQQFEIITDHKNLEYFMSTKPLSRRQIRWWEFLSDFSFVLKHRPGTLNDVADKLSRKAQYALDQGDRLAQHMVLLPPERLAFIRGQLILHQDFEEAIKESLDKDDFFTACQQWMEDPEEHPKPKLLKSKEMDPDSEFGGLTLENGLLFFNDRLYVPPEHRLLVLMSRHDSPIAGHFGVTKTTSLVKRDYYWPGISADIKGYVSSCETCARSKAPTHAPFGLLHPLPVPSKR
eukprot:TRINITY_DN5544_c0_g1_i9.p1 TRINITY_DN5544_c0_g1~~TRINITY_DN5544_c0_g1_i9.p1  ORF type:complete len:345 (-),score=31.02 TRINITY_DN5544_c0_g1_i9:1032-2066(-)